MNTIIVQWPNGMRFVHLRSISLLQAAQDAGIDLPVGCIRGSCGTCEVDINGMSVRACVKNLAHFKDEILVVTLIDDPYW